MNVPIRKFKAELSRYIREASAGKDVVVTSRGKPVARILPPLVPAASSKSLSRQELVERIKVLMPEVRIGTGKAPKGSANPIKIRPGEKTMAEIVIEGRGPR
jgi:prevent-host-death family protein